MKKKYIVFVGLLFFSLIIFLFFRFNQKEDFKVVKLNKNNTLNENRNLPYLIVHNKPQLIKVIKYSTVFNEHIDDVRFYVSGELINVVNELGYGCSFKEDQLLFRINNKEVLADLIQSKKILYNSISEILPKIEASYPNEIIKWNNFLESIKPVTLLTEIPPFSSESEKELLNKNGVLQFYNDVLQSEKQMEKYFYLAPYDGFLIRSYADKNKIIKQGDLVASISKSKDLLIRFLISKNEFELTSKNIIFYRDEKKEIGKGVLKGYKKNRNSNSIEVCYLIDKKLNERITLGSQLGVEFNSTQHCCIVPSNLIKKGKVKIMDGQKTKNRKVVVLGENSNGFFVKGLLNGQKIIL